MSVCVCVCAIVWLFSSIEMNECFESEQVMNNDHKMFSATAECLISEPADGVMK